MNQHRYDNVVSELEVVADTENCVPKDEQVEEVEFTSEKQAQPSTERT